MAGKRKLRLIVNVIPLINVNTGIGRYLKCLYQNIERRYGDVVEMGYFDGYEVLADLPSGPRDYQRWSKQVDLFWKIPPVAAAGIRTFFHWSREIRFRLVAKHFDLYHEAAFFPFLAPRGTKTVFTLHDFSLFRFPQYHPKERVLFAKLFFKRRCRRVDHFISVSDFTRREAQHYLGLNGKRITVIPLANNGDVFFPRTAEEVEDLRRRTGLPEDYFVFVGTGDPRKNRPVISRALSRAGLDIPLAIAGWSGWSAESPHEKNIIGLSYVSDEDLARLYSGARALVYPSVYEGFGLPVIEAMSCGCPVICSRRAGLPEAAGEAALYLENPVDENELAGLLRRVAEDHRLRQELAAKGRVQARSFSWEKTARRTIESFRAVL